MLENFFFGKHLEDDELVALIVHRYWGIGARSLFWPTFSFLAGLVAAVVAPVPLVFFLVIAWSVFSIVWWIQNFLDYYLDVWIITDHGIIDLQWNGWFHRQSTRILYSDVQGVSHETKGITETLMRCGTVSVEKISTGTSFSLPNVRNPRSIEALILRNQEGYLHKKNLKNAKHVQDLLADFVASRINENELPAEQDKPKKKSTMVTRKV